MEPSLRRHSAERQGGQTLRTEENLQSGECLQYCQCWDLEGVGNIVIV